MCALPAEARRGVRPSELELQAVVSHPAWAWESHPVSKRAIGARDHQATPSVSLILRSWINDRGKLLRELIPQYSDQRGPQLSLDPQSHMWPEVSHTSGVSQTSSGSPYGHRICVQYCMSETVCVWQGVSWLPVQSSVVIRDCYLR